MPILLKGRVEKQPAQITLLVLGEAEMKSGLLRSLQCFTILSTWFKDLEPQSTNPALSLLEVCPVVVWTLLHEEGGG